MVDIGLIVIWDVLKHFDSTNVGSAIWINSNMGCIETKEEEPESIPLVD